MKKFELLEKLEFLLHIKHWKFFLLFFVIPNLIWSVGLVSMIYTGSRIIYIVISIILGIFFSALFLGWIWTLVTKLYTKLPVGVDINIKRFKFLFRFYIGYMIFFATSISLTMFFTNNLEPITLSSAFTIILLIVFLVIFVLHIFSMFSMLYIWLFIIPKIFKSVELQKKATFNDYKKELLMFWFFPIGVWWLQPRINKIFSNEKLRTVR
jgi:hypothetical protein